MKTVQRLKEAFTNGRLEMFDETSKYVFLSDCHRGNGNQADEFTKNQNTFQYALSFYYQRGFTYVEVGDGDELWEHPRIKDIKNAHFETFEIIKRFHQNNRFILIFGNHNIYLKDPNYVEKNLFTHLNEHSGQQVDFLMGIKPEEGLVLKHKRTGQQIFVVHGHQGDFSNDQFWYLNMLSLKYFWRFLHSVGVQNPSSPVKNENKRHKIEKNYAKWIEKYRMMLICGHTHRLKFPKKDDLPYFNTGCCIYPTSLTAIELENSEITFVRWKIQANDEGMLQVERNVIHGPSPIEKFDIR
jgi:UDP-2,3-diacylglucosamine pyrophosphatase LpxH